MNGGRNHIPNLQSDGKQYAGGQTVLQHQTLPKYVWNRSMVTVEEVLRDFPRAQFIMEMDDRGKGGRGNTRKPDRKGS